MFTSLFFRNSRYRASAARRCPNRQMQVEELEARSLMSATTAAGVASVIDGVQNQVRAVALPSVRILATDSAAAETVTGQSANTGMFTVTRTGSTTRSLRVNFQISGTASNGGDYTSLATSVQIPIGQSTATIRVTPRDDASREITEGVTLAIASNTAYTIDATARTATVSIADNDSPDPRIAAIVAEVQQTNTTAPADSYTDFLSLLPVNQTDQRGYSGVTPQPGLLATRNAVYSALERALLPVGGTVSYQNFNVGGYVGRNIVGILPGQGAHRSQQYMITAHYDSVEIGGADDNGSGVAGLLAAAHVLSKHKFDATVVFVAMDQEEERANGWGVGSRHFAQTAKTQGTDLRGVMVLDMIAYNHAGGNKAVVGQADYGTTPSTALVGDIRQAFQRYTNLVTINEPGINETDALRFQQAGFPVATLIEQLDTDGSLLNPYYHEASDFYRTTTGQIQQYNGRPYLDLAYATQMTRGTVAWVSSKASLLDPVTSATSAGSVSLIGTARTILASPIVPTLVSEPSCYPTTIQPNLSLNSPGPRDLLATAQATRNTTPSTALVNAARKPVHPPVTTIDTLFAEFASSHGQLSTALEI